MKNNTPSGQEHSWQKAEISEYDDSGLVTDINIITGTVTIRFAEAVPARYIKIHSHYNERNEAYDAIDESTFGLVSADPVTVYKQVGGGRNEFYLYDDKGNRTMKTLTGANAVTSDYVYYENSDWIKTDSKYGYTYDANGNLTEKGTIYTQGTTADGLDKLTINQTNDYTAYSYDLRGRLTEVKKYNSDTLTLETVANYTYDINGYRIQKTKGSETTKYVFDLSGNMIEEIDSTNGSKQYIFMGMTHIAQIDSEGTKYFGTDHLGSTTLMVDSDGNVLHDKETTPFGDQEDKEDVFYTGKTWDKDAGLYYFNARWYDADLGRFITEDPIKDGMLWYAYCGNNPMGRIDPSGMFWYNGPNGSDQRSNFDDDNNSNDPNNSDPFEVAPGKIYNPDKMEITDIDKEKEMQQQMRDVAFKYLILNLALGKISKEDKQFSDIYNKRSKAKTDMKSLVDKYVEKKYDNSFLKSNAEINAYRGVFGKPGKDLYEGLITLDILGVPIFEEQVHTWADWSRKTINNKDGTLNAGKYTGILSNDSNSYKDYIQILDFDDTKPWYQHPNAKNKTTDVPYNSKGKPWGLGCLIMKIDAFNKFIFIAELNRTKLQTKFPTFAKRIPQNCIVHN